MGGLEAAGCEKLLGCPGEEVWEKRLWEAYGEPVDGPVGELVGYLGAYGAQIHQSHAKR